MAKKKTAKKSAKKAASRTTAKVKKAPARKAAKAAPKKAPAKRTAPKKKTYSLDPVPVSTGSGASAADIGSELVSMFNGGQLKEIEERFWSPDIVSVEGAGVAMAWHGKAAVDAKNAWWSSDHTIFAASAEGPYVGASGFAVKFVIDVETKSTGQRQLMEEVGVYTVKNGKIVREEFMYRR